MTALVVLGLLGALLVAVCLFGRYGPEPPPPEPTLAELMDELGRQFRALGAAIAEQLTPALQRVAAEVAALVEALRPPD